MTIVVWVLVTPFALWALVRLLGLERGWLMVTGIAFTPYAAVASVVPLALALATGWWWAAGVTAATAVVLAACVVPRMVGRPERREGVALRVLTANVLLGQADPDALVGLVGQHGPDALAIQEYTPEFARKLTAAGLDGLLPYRVVDAQPGGHGSALYSRHPLTATGSRVGAGGYRSTVGTLEVPGGQAVLVESAHPPAPYAAHQLAYWLTGQAALDRATPDGPLRLLAGDFNSTLDHAALRALIRSGYRDAASVVGRGGTPTWRGYWHGLPRTRMPGVTLDHVLADRRIGIRAVVVCSLPGSDHRPLFAELVLPDPAASNRYAGTGTNP
ncbi:endonuclease/exonuclease/phosphatase family protein [Rugosimonospora africana]|uniref:Endonuclease n=1 Tax=Rugosimonospora africana TaxID=556532 RepID=A0A8J3VPL7_9ACTN|nr:endonuclease/exonuclease/phosphatase family protein [Rugosimonospora africana]GIH13556.1 endonuclease [Rugosimonospora africana]